MQNLYKKVFDWRFFIVFTFGLIPIILSSITKEFNFLAVSSYIVFEFLVLFFFAGVTNGLFWKNLLFKIISLIILVFVIVSFLIYKNEGQEVVMLDWFIAFLVPLYLAISRKLDIFFRTISLGVALGFWIFFFYSLFDYILNTGRIGIDALAPAGMILWATIGGVAGSVVGTVLTLMRVGKK